MSKGLDALEKIDHTICLNNIDGNIKWSLDKYDNCDCKDMNEFIDCFETIEKELKALEIIKKYVGIQQDDDDIFPYGIVDKQYVACRSNLIMSKEEYELVKEILECKY